MSSPPAPSAPAPEAPRPRERLSEVLAYRSLIESYFRRQLRTRFLGSRLGWVWSLVNPLVMLAAYSIVFGVILVADRGMPPAASGIRLFAVFLFTGLRCWSILVSVLTQTLDWLLARTGQSTPQAAMRHQHAARRRADEIGGALSQIALATKRDDSSGRSGRTQRGGDSCLRGDAGGPSCAP